MKKWNDIINSPVIRVSFRNERLEFPNLYEALRDVKNPFGLSGSLGLETRIYNQETRQYLYYPIHGSHFIFFDLLGLKIPTEIIFFVARQLRKSKTNIQDSEVSRSYRFLPEPGTGKNRRLRLKYRNIFRLIGTFSEKREHLFSQYYDEDIKEFNIHIRAKRSYKSLPDTMDDISRTDLARSWKKYRKTQWK